MAVSNLQVLDVHGLNLIIQKLKDGTLVVGKAGSVDAAQLSGTIPLDKLPKAALERITIVETEAARLALTSDDVQNGDSIKVTQSGKMYAVVDDTKARHRGGIYRLCCRDCGKGGSCGCCALGRGDRQTHGIPAGEPCPHSCRVWSRGNPGRDNRGDYQRNL